jgi:hypothetical protein
MAGGWRLAAGDERDLKADFASSRDNQARFLLYS